MQSWFSNLLISANCRASSLTRDSIRGSSLVVAREIAWHRKSRGGSNKCGGIQMEPLRVSRILFNHMSEADLKPADILSFLPQFPTDQDLNSHQE
jgi:hypothetical protein